MAGGRLQANDITSNEGLDAPSLEIVSSRKSAQPHALPLVDGELPDAVYGDFLTWAQEHGVVVNGVRAAKIHGRGLGIIAERDIKVNDWSPSLSKDSLNPCQGEVLVFCPKRTFVSVDHIPQSFKDKHKGSNVHGLLASFLTNGPPELAAGLKPWTDTWPSLQDFRATMPALWPHHLLGVGPFGSRASAREPATCPLPPKVGGSWLTVQLDEQQMKKERDSCLLAKQDLKLQKELEKAIREFPDMVSDEYVYNWFVVNTRSFYYDMLRHRPKAKEDRMVLVPFADLFNHADHGCRSYYDHEGFEITSDRDYGVGEEIFICYGPHSNDALLVEYGFVPDENVYDSLSLDALVLCAKNGIDGKVQARLRAANYLADYSVNKDGPCYRTGVAARTQTLALGVRAWKEIIGGRATESAAQEAKAAAFMCERYLLPFYLEAENALRLLGELDVGSVEHGDGMRATLVRRWGQIVDMLRAATRNEAKGGEYKALREKFGLTD